MTRMPTHDTRDGVTLFYQDWDGAKPVLFAHSWALSSRMWQYQMVALHDRGARCIAYDRRGHGRSDQPGSGYDFDRLADDLAEIIERLDLRGLTLVGHSMGCSEITRYLVRRGDERVERVAFVSPVGPFPTRTPDNPNGVDPAMIAASRASWKQDFPAWMDANADAYIARGLAGDDVSPGLVEWTKNDMLSASLLALVECHRAIADTDQRAELEKIAV